jgi:hypothetical protein
MYGTTSWLKTMYIVTALKDHVAAMVHVPRGSASGRPGSLLGLSLRNVATGNEPSSHGETVRQWQLTEVVTPLATFGCSQLVVILLAQ